MWAAKSRFIHSLVTAHTHTHSRIVVEHVVNDTYFSLSFSHQSFNQNFVCVWAPLPTIFVWVNVKHMTARRKYKSNRLDVYYWTTIFWFQYFVLFIYRVPRCERTVFFVRLASSTQCFWDDWRPKRKQIPQNRSGVWCGVRYANCWTVSLNQHFVRHHCVLCDVRKFLIYEMSSMPHIPLHGIRMNERRKKVFFSPRTNSLYCMIWCCGNFLLTKKPNY